MLSTVKELQNATFNATFNVCFVDTVVLSAVTIGYMLCFKSSCLSHGLYSILDLFNKPQNH